MRSLRIGLPVGLLLIGAAAHAGTITTTINGLSVANFTSGDIVTVEGFLTIDPGDTPISPTGSVGAGYEISFAADGGVATLVSSTPPAGWFPLPTGPCAGSTCQNAFTAGILFPSPGPLPTGTPISLGSLTIDTTGLAPGVYAAAFNLTGAGDAIFSRVGVDVSSEYTLVNAVFGTFAPEPGTAALLGLGLAWRGIDGRRRRSSS